MITLLPSHYVLQEVTQDDLALASLAWGFTIGFGWLTTWTAIKQTRQIYMRLGLRVFCNAYVWMIWLEILVCLIFGIICWLHLKGIIPPSFAFYFCILTTWALQVQFLLQIIINRCSILLTDKRHAYRLKVGVAILITAVNISVYNIWIPARLQVSEKYIWLNDWWDRCEKVIYLIVDGALNFYFIRIVQQNLVKHGLTKYKSLVRFNMFIVGFSLSMDVLIISMMSLHNTFVYMQFHPFAYIVKLKIEMSMADLIGKIAKRRADGITSDSSLHNLDGAKMIYPENSLASSCRRKEISVDEIEAICGDDVSIETRETTKAENNITGHEEARSDVGDVEKFVHRYSSSSLPVGAAISTMTEIRIEVNASPSSYGPNGAAASSDEERLVGKGDNDTMPRDHKYMGHKKAIGTSTNIWGNEHPLS
ncbi:hypothetical protein BKA66DRAFT_565985 [Pyrenochaeta sp. MPI-SDFR-AT-0127]|nr:hypothetical protein BKA66DRAFT_565985 [Pyrenochaeta sp. MPI-SDFR-AT-0127]